MGPGWTEVGAGVGGVRVWVGGRGWVGWSGEGLELGGGGGRGEVLVPGLRRGGGWGGWCWGRGGAEGAAGGAAMFKVLACLFGREVRNRQIMPSFCACVFLCAYACACVCWLGRCISLYVILLCLCMCSTTG